MLEKIPSSEVSASRSKTGVCEARKQERCGSSWITRLPNWGCQEHYPSLVKQQVASAAHHATPSASVDSGVAQKASQRISECSSVHSIHRKEMKQCLSFPDSGAGVRMLWQFLKNERDVTCIRERGSGKVFYHHCLILLKSSSHSPRTSTAYLFIRRSPKNLSKKDNFSAAKSMRNLQCPSKNVLFSNSESWSPESRNPCYLTQNQQEASVCYWQAGRLLGAILILYEGCNMSIIK